LTTSIIAAAKSATFIKIKTTTHFWIYYYFDAGINGNSSSTIKATSTASAPHLGDSSLPNYLFWQLASATTPVAVPALMLNGASQYSQINYYYFDAGTDGTNSSTMIAASMASAQHLGNSSLPNYLTAGNYFTRTY
jgi:hypothetical protein